MPAEPLDEGTSRRLRRQATRDTKPELAIRSELHRRGLRYRVDRRPEKDIRSRADIVFGPARVAVFVDGCFWHRCPEHGTLPVNNREWWATKLGENSARDRSVTHALSERGWVVMRIWEHENPIEAARRIEDTVRSRRPGSG